MPRPLRSVLLVLLSLAASLALGQSWSGRVVGVADGDTITVLRELGGGRKEDVKVRLWGIDAPESGQPHGAGAKQRLSDLVFGKDVLIEHKDTDRYGRTVAIIRGQVEGQRGEKVTINVNQRMVAIGYAWWYKQFAPGDRDLERLEREARAAKRGLWSDASPIAPWEWRQGKRTTTAPAARSTAPPAQRTPPTQQVERTVYVTKTGTKYHADGCRYLRQSKIAIGISAAKRSYTACSVCGGG